MCTRFIKDFICEKFYCSTDLFFVKVQTKEFVITEDDKGNIKGLFLRNNYENLFNADDLISAGVFVQFVQEVKRLYEK